MSLSKSPTTSAELRDQIAREITTQFEVANGRRLLGMVNKNCFAKCVASPGSSLSSKENGCLANCAQKYMKAFNVVSEECIKIVQEDGGLQRIAFI